MARIPLSMQEIPHNIEDLRKFYKKLAKYGDIKMKAIEASEIPYAKEYAYRVASEDISRFSTTREIVRKSKLSAKGSKTLQLPRWERSTKGLHYQTLAAKTRALQKFLNAPTSTEKGITEGYQQRVDKINSNFGTDFTPTQMKAFFRSNFWRKMIASGYSSSETLEIIGTLQANNINTKEKFQELVNKANEQDITIRNKKLGSDIRQEAVEESVINLLKKELDFDKDDKEEEEKLNFEVSEALYQIIGRI